MVVLMQACKINTAISCKKGVEVANNRLIIYKTTHDYSKNVPIDLSVDGSRIVSFPAPLDLVKTNNELRYPIKLLNGYFLDQKGISSYTVFISLCYEEYSKLNSAPKADSLYQLILEINPIQEYYIDSTYIHMDKEAYIELINSFIKKNSLEQELYKVK